ncbi:MAG: NUDIX domain-containing protein [Azovibrio sp.]
MSESLQDLLNKTGMDLQETQLSSELVYKGGLLEVRRDQIRLPDGKQAYREYIVHPGAVVIVPVLPDGRLVFERQFRYPVGRIFLELPAGKIDTGESMEATAIRELLEETGYEAERWTDLGMMHPCIGYSNEKIGVFLAEGLIRHSGPQLDEGEFLEIFTLGFDEVREAIIRGEITDAKTISAIFMAQLNLMKREQ